MDFLRYEGELNFISYLPKKTQLDTFKKWNEGDKWIASHKDEDSWKRKSQVKYKTDNYPQEFIEEVVNNHILKSTNISFDTINYYKNGHELPSLPKELKTHEDIRNGFRALTSSGTGFIKHIVDFGANTLYIRLDMNDGRQIMGTMIINRWHDNVNSFLSVDTTLDSAKDSIDFSLGPIGSYPNAFLIVKEDDMLEFFDMLMNFEKTPKYYNTFKKFGVSRSDKDFWEYYDWFQEYFNKTQPLTSGMFDLNRYYHKPW